MTESISETWFKLPKELQDSLLALIPGFGRNGKVYRDAMSYERKFKRDKCNCDLCKQIAPNIKNIVTAISIFVNIEPLRVIKSNYNDLFAYNLNGEKVIFHTLLCDRPNIKVIAGTLGDREVVVKFDNREGDAKAFYNLEAEVSESASE